MITGTRAADAGPLRILLVGWDGVQRDHLTEMIAAEEVPNLMALAELGNLVAIDMRRPTSTKPGWAEILTGYHSEMTGVHNNDYFRAIPSGYSIFERLEAFFGSENIYTAAVVGKRGNVGAAAPELDAEEPFLGEPYYLTQFGMDYFESHLMDAVEQRALDVLEDRAAERFFIFVHYHQPDFNGHRFGENSVEYTDAIKANDESLGLLVSKLEELGVREDTLIYVTSDHGFNEGTTSHGDAPFTFLATDDPEVVRRGHRVDVAATVLWRFGVDLDGLRPRLIGRPLTSELTPGLFDDPGYELEPCGSPELSGPVTGMLLWKKCSAPDEWRMRVVSPGRYTGVVTSNEPFIDVIPMSVEPEDLVELTDPLHVTFDLRVGLDGDGFILRFPDDANVCFGIDSLETLEARLGKHGTTIPIPFNLSGLNACNPRSKK